jgi:hypothetical protein
MISYLALCQPFLAEPSTAKRVARLSAMETRASMGIAAYDKAGTVICGNPV